MPLVDILADFRVEAAQCDNLIANAHQQRPDGTYFLPELDRRQIAAAALLNFFVAFESFLESAIVSLMAGAPTISGAQPVKYVSPPTEAVARSMLIGTQRYFDYGNLDFVRKMVALYFQNGHPFEPYLGSIASEWNDLRVMRHSAAHIAFTTQMALEALSLRIFAKPRPGIDVYTVMTSVDPRSATGETVFTAYKAKVLVAAELIANG